MRSLVSLDVARAWLVRSWKLATLLNDIRANIIRALGKKRKEGIGKGRSDSENCECFVGFYW